MQPTQIDLYRRLGIKYVFKEVEVTFSSQTESPNHSLIT